MFPKLFSKEYSYPTRSVLRWFSFGFLSLSIICFLVQIPLILHYRDVFTDLEMEKTAQQLSAGINQLDATTAAISNASISVYEDSRFYSLHYKTDDFSHITVATRNQMHRYISSLLIPNSLILDGALQLSEANAVALNVTTFDSWTGYYPFYLQVDDLSFSEWETLLRENHIGYLPVHKITTPYRSYNALIYSIEWGQDKYFFACMNVADIRKAMIGTDNLDNCKLTIQRNDGSYLYSELEDSNIAYTSISQKTATGGLTITVHIPNSVFSERLLPLYFFLSVYLIFSLLVVIISVLLGVRFSSTPLLKIITLLENRHASATHLSSSCHKPLNYGFHFIENQIQSYEEELQQYQSTIDIQTKVLQARFMEKALHGNLVTEADLTSFYSYFTNFPSSFRLVLLDIAEDPGKGGNIYPNVMAIVQYYLSQNTKQAYIQQITSTSLLLVFDEKYHQTYTDSINLLIENINREEPCYHVWGIISKMYNDPKDISFAYMQIQDLRSKISTDSLSQLCTATDIKTTSRTQFQISDTTVIYSSITSGNLDLALFYLDNYESHLSNRAVYQMFYSILLCIKQEYADILIDIKVPTFRSQTDLYPGLKECITTFCQLLQAEADANSVSFAHQVKAFIDIHYPEEALCSVSLEEQFHCSFVKIRKSFSKQFGVSISAYIESRRMALANELLVQGDLSITEVFQKCGYSNYNTFLKAYRRTYGSTPSSLKQAKGNIKAFEQDVATTESRDG